MLLRRSQDSLTTTGAEVAILTWRVRVTEVALIRVAGVVGDAVVVTITKTAVAMPRRTIAHSTEVVSQWHRRLTHRRSLMSERHKQTYTSRD